MADKEVKLIDTELLRTNIAQIAKACAKSDKQKALVGRILFMIENMPTVEAEPVKHGRWIYDGDCMITSCCNTAYDINKFQNNNGTILVPTICPNCGRKMDGDESPKGE